MKEFESWITRGVARGSVSMLLETASISLTFLTLWVGAQDTRQSPTQSPEIGYKSAADADQRKTLLLKDFNPTSMLHAAANRVERAKSYVIDVHNHVNDAQESRIPYLSDG